METNFLLIALTIFVSSIVQGGTGFAFSLIAVPVLIYLFPDSALPAIPPLMMLFNLMSNGIMLAKFWRLVDLRIISMLLLGGFMGIWPGSRLPYVIPIVPFKILAGAVVALAGILMWRGVKAKTAPTGPKSFAIGFASGILNASLTIGGPPVALFFNATSESKDQFRATLTSYFFIMQLGNFLVFALQGRMNAQVFVDFAYLAPAVLVGSVLGIWLAKFIPEDIFRKLVLVLVIASGVSLILTAL